MPEHSDPDDAEEARLGFSGVESTFRFELFKTHGDGVDPGVTLRDESVSGETTRVEHLAKGKSHERYVVRGEVGRGGMGAVLRVFDTDLRRSLAMKVILGHGGEKPDGTPAVDQESLGRFLEEAQVTGQLDHPGVVPVHELGLDAEGRVYFTMQLVRGRDFKKILELVASGAEDWNTTRALGVLLRVCEAMAYAHDKGVVHRDLKPANVMVGKYGEVYVMDWGLARVEGHEDSRDLRLEPTTIASLSEVRTDRKESRASESDSPILTLDGTVMGTPAYMPPEQARGEVERVGPRSDVYSVGAMLYQLLTGEVPYVPDGARISPRTLLMRVIEGPPKSVHELARVSAPAELEAICEKAMAREMGDRYPEMGALAADLRAYLEGRVVRAYRTGAVAEFKKWVGRNKALAASVLIATLSIVGVSLTASFVLAGKNRDLDAANKAARQERDNVLRLSALQNLEDLAAEAEGLWPAVPAMIDDFRGWLDRAQDLIDGLEPRATGDDPGHRAQLVTLRARAVSEQAAEVGGRETLTFADEEDRWWHAQLEKLVFEIEAFADEETGLVWGRSPTAGWGVARRLAFAEALRDGFAPGGALAARWERDLPAIRAAYPGLVLPVQVGLVPIGADPGSGLWEFWHCATGAEPQRGADGKLQLTEESGVVLVLLPGGAFWMGAQKSDPAGRNYDVNALGNEVPVHQVTLTPFFLSKYELTQGQWKRFVGWNRSTYGPDAGIWSDNWLADAPEPSALHPLEKVSWVGGMRELARMGLSLPSEAQWEYGARAGTETSWWTGSEKRGLQGAANLADRYARANGGLSTLYYEEDLDDGSTVHAPVGSYAANPFGLHDVYGNLEEWCLDGYDKSFYARSPATDPVAPWEGVSHRVKRGGGFFAPARYATSAGRVEDPAPRTTFDAGIRPARAITE